MAIPDDFWWGGGAPSVAIEGAGLRSDWFRWEERRNLEQSMDGNGFRDHFEEDLAVLAAHGLRHLRMTIEWARIEPFAGRIDHEELEHVERCLDTARGLGVAVWATLHHTSLPGWFSEDTDGFRTTRGSSIHWSRHVDRMAELFDPYVAAWAPIEDPIGWAVRAHHLGTRPGRVSEEAFRDAAEGVVNALFDAHRLLSSGPTPVVATFGLPTLRPASPEAEARRRDWEETFWHSWTRAITEGVLSWPWKAAIERPDMADAFDVIGIGITPSLTVSETGLLTTRSTSSHVDAAGTTPVPGHLGETLQRAAELLDGRELVVTGLGVSTEDDRWRSDLIGQWLEEIASAIAEGLPVRGAFLEPVFDGYDMTSGSHLDSGVFSRSREPKSSFEWVAAQQ